MIASYLLSSARYLQKVGSKKPLESQDIACLLGKHFEQEKKKWLILTKKKC